MFQPTSKLGTVLGGRTAKRFFSTIDQRIPGPGEYNLPSIFPEYFRQSWAPFDSSTERHFKTSPVPGYCIYCTLLFSLDCIILGSVF